MMKQELILPAANRRLHAGSFSAEWLPRPKREESVADGTG